MSNWRKRLGFELEPAGGHFPAPVFIVGCMRSGTTFLVDKLTQHPQLLKMGAELRTVWTEIAQAPIEHGSCEARSANDLEPALIQNMTHYFSQYIQDSQGWSRYLMRGRYKWRFGAGRIHYDWKHIRPVNKSTHLVNKLDFVMNMFPTAQLIFIVRSIEGQVASMKKFISQHHQEKGWIYGLPENSNDCWAIREGKAAFEGAEMQGLFPGDFSILPRMWIRLNALAFQSMETLPTDRVLVVSYEDLVRHQESILNQLFEKLKLEKAHQKRASKIAAHRLKVYNTSSKGDPLEKWKRDLTTEEQADIQRICTEAQSKYDYICKQLGKQKIEP